MTGDNLNLYLVHIKAYNKFSQILSVFLKILSGNKIMTSLNGHNSMANKLNVRYT